MSSTAQIASDYRPLRVAASLAVLWIGLCAVAPAAMVDRYWEVSPYKIQVLVDYRLSHVWNEKLQQSLPDFIDTRAKVAIGPLWHMSLQTMPQVLGESTDTLLVSLDDETLQQVRQDYDKLIVVILKESSTGYTAVAQEYDCLLETWGQLWKFDTRNAADLEELTFHAMREAFSPMATFKVKREDTTQVELQMRGALLPRLAHSMPVLSEGQVLRPTLRRTDRTGQPVENGIQAVPWTYLSANPVEGPNTSATIVSHTRMPMGVRQRGRVDQVAMLVRPGSRQTELRLHARDSEDLPLAGFRVYQRNNGAEDGDFVGKSEDDGTIVIHKGDTPIQVAFVQSSGQWIAKIPVVPGADGVINAPLADDSDRQQAEAKLVSIQEQLIDYVARRNILASRARLKIKQNDLTGASKLISQLDSIPSATLFDQRYIRPQEQLIKSKDPRVQARISALFSGTRDVLTEFLAPGLADELKREVAAAGSAPNL